MLAALLLAAMVVGASAGATARADAQPLVGIHNIQHVVMIMQENRSFDNYFGTYPGANRIPRGVCVPDPVHGGCVKPFHDSLDKNYGGPHAVTSAVKDINGGKMDGFVAQMEKSSSCGNGPSPGCSPCGPKEPGGEGKKVKKVCLEVMGYHDAREIPNYWTYAQNFVLQDNMFASSRSWSSPEHNFMVSGWSGTCPLEDPNPMHCESSLEFPGPNRTWTDITYLLKNAGVSWRYYVFEGGEPDCESDEAITCRPKRQGPKTLGIWNPLRAFTDVKQDGQLEDIQSLTNFYGAVHQQGSCGLPNVAWIDPNMRVSEHPPSKISNGQKYVTTLVNSIMRSPCWSSTAIFISWDEWGGFYDHVVPPALDANGLGLRVPGLTISPYARTSYIDHQSLSHDSYLKFIEDAFLGGARLNPATDGRPDSRPSVREENPLAGDLASEFDFNQAPRPPLLLSVEPPPGPPSEPPE